jgi:hypothetical protein
MVQDAASIADIIGAIGVMISLVFVGLQVAQANKLARAAAQQKQIESVRDLSRVMIENPHIAPLVGKRDAELTPAERVFAVAFTTYSERTWEALYEQYRQGLVDSEVWEAHRRHARSVQADPVNQAVWKLRKHWYSERYQKFRDADGANPADKLGYDLDTSGQQAPGGRHD